jgi:hypothetical protein
VYPAGEYVVGVSKELSYTVDVRQTSSYRRETYIPSTLVIGKSFIFEPGKRYILENIYPDLRYNGRTLESPDPDVTVLTFDGKVTVFHEGMRIREVGTMPFSTHIGLESQGSILSGWFYKDLLITGGGPRLGLSIIHGYLDIKLLAEAGAGGILTVPGMTSLAAPSWSVYYGGVADVFLNNIGLEFGGGMIIAHTPYPDIQWDSGSLKFVSDPDDDDPYQKMSGLFTTPYLQAAILFRGKMNGGSKGIYFQYYLNGEEWHNTFGAGLKLWS